MSVVNLKIVVSSLNEVIRVFDRIKVHRSTTGAAGPYIEATTPSTRLLLQSSVVTYEFTDQLGSPSYYYRVSYYNSVSLLESSLSEPQQGEGDSALDIISVDELKAHYLFGVDLTKDDGAPYPQSIFEFFIKSAVSWLEHKLDLPIRPQSYKEESHDYDPNAYTSWMFVKVNHFPILSVEEIKLMTPAGETALVVNPSWIRVQKEAGEINILPNGAQGLSWIGSVGMYYTGLRTARFLPDFFRVSYTAGLESGKVPDVIKHCVGMIAAYGPLNIAGDLIGGAGIASQSVSIDGLSQSINTTSSPTCAGYAARIIQYNKEVKDMIPTLRRYYKGTGLIVV